MLRIPNEEIEATKYKVGRKLEGVAHQWWNKKDTDQFHQNHFFFLNMVV